MTDTELDALEAAAKAATPGPWEYDDADEDMAALGAENQRVKDAAYIAAANPSTVLELIQELRQARKERDWLAEQIGGNLPCPPYSILIDEADCDNECCEDCWLKAAKEAVCQK